METEQKNPVKLGQLLEKCVLGVSISKSSDLARWRIDDYPSILVWECEHSLSEEETEAILAFWIQHGTRTIVFGGTHAAMTENRAIRLLAKFHEHEGFDELVLTSYAPSFAGGIWRAGHTGFADDPLDRTPLIHVACFSGVTKLRESRDLIERMNSDWIPESL